MTGRSQPITLGTSTSADSRSRTGRETRNCPASPFSLASHSGPTGRTRRLRIRWIQIQPAQSRPESAITPVSHAATNQGKNGRIGIRSRRGGPSTVTAGPTPGPPGPTPSWPRPTPARTGRRPEELRRPDRPADSPGRAAPRLPLGLRHSTTTRESRPDRRPSGAGPSTPRGSGRPAIRPPEAATRATAKQQGHDRSLPEEMHQ